MVQAFVCQGSREPGEFCKQLDLILIRMFFRVSEFLWFLFLCGRRELLVTVTKANVLNIENLGKGEF